MTLRRLGFVSLAFLLGCSRAAGPGGDLGVNLDGGDGDGGTSLLSIEPLDQVVTVQTGQPAPTVQYVAKLDGQSVAAAFTIDRGELGTLDPASGLFTAAAFAG